MTIIYDIIVRVAWIVIHLLAPFNKKFNLWLIGQKQLFSQIESYRKTTPKSKKTVWFHVASLGEFEQGRPIIEYLKLHHPTIEIILTFFSPSGYEIRKNYEYADFITYLPLDTVKNAQKFIQLVKPDITVFVKYEFWHHHLDALQKNNIPTFLISAIFRKNQLFFKPMGIFFRNMLKNINYFFVQNEDSAKLLTDIGIQNVIVAGDTRIDRVLKIAKTVPKNTIVESFVKNKKILIAGSTWAAGETILTRHINTEKHEDWKYIIAPHEIHEEHIQKLLSLLQVPYVRYTKAKKENLDTPKVLIIDNIGLLNQLYKYGRIAYIGGGFGKGIHNILEPAAFGCPIIFGNNHQKFDEANRLIASNGAFVINNFEDFEYIFDYLNEEENYQGASSKVTNFLKENKGATDKVVLEMEKIINSW